MLKSYTQSIFERFKLNLDMVGVTCSSPVVSIPKTRPQSRFCCFYNQTPRFGLLN